MPACLQWGEERHQECSQTEDRGYNECAAQEDRGYSECCDWAPCSWFCDAWVWISNLVCVAWTWISNVVCVAWTWITTVFCLVWDVVTTIVNAILVTLESILGWVLSAIAFIIELLEMIPVIGTLIRWIINAITLVINIIISIPDFVLGLIGIRPEKKLRVCSIILRDEKGNLITNSSDVVPLLQLAVDVYKRDANVRWVPSQAFKYTSGFGAGETVDANWIIQDGSSSGIDLLEQPCSAEAEWLVTGSKIQLKSSTLCFFYNWRRVLGYGAPVTVFIIREVTGDAIGCSLFITDYVTADLESIRSSPRTIGHEVGHSCMLWHVCVDEGTTNMMATAGACDPASSTEPDRANPVMDDWQALRVRASKHATYF